ncbi:MAG: hypothetical protein HY332_03620 [Chloroflexi bacterium]|nr:hypothetical protein [Chloroflexota bacterium]
MPFPGQPDAAEALRILAPRAALVVAVWGALLTVALARGLRFAWPFVAAAALWLQWDALSCHRPAGVTASDPYVYVQIAADLTERGTPLHAFPLSALPTTHVGYGAPDAAGAAASVWPPGHSVALAAAYRVAGDAGLSGLNRLVGLLASAATGVLTLAVLRTAPRTARWQAPWAATGAAVAASYELFSWLAAPMADGLALALSALAVAAPLAAVASPPRGVLAPPASAAPRALLLGAAFSVRYTQALLVPGIAAIAWFGFPASRLRAAFLAAWSAGTALAVAPDAWYRTQLHGAPWRFAKGEVTLLTLEGAADRLAYLASELTLGREFGWLLPLALVGMPTLVWCCRLGVVGLLLAYAPPFALHVLFPGVRPRHVLHAYAAIAVLCATGPIILLKASAEYAASAAGRVTVELRVILDSGAFTTESISILWAPEFAERFGFTGSDPPAWRVRTDERGWGVLDTAGLVPNQYGTYRLCFEGDASPRFAPAIVVVADGRHVVAETVATATDPRSGAAAWISERERHPSGPGAVPLAAGVVSLLCAAAVVALRVPVRRWLSVPLW